MHNPPLWQVIGIGIVLSHAVIPNAQYHPVASANAPETPVW